MGAGGRDGVAPGRRTGRGHVARAHRAASAGGRVRVVERHLEELHQAPRAGGVPAHQVGLGLAHLAERVPLRRVVHPGRPGGCPAVGPPHDDIVDGQDLEQRVDASTTQPRCGLDRGHRCRSVADRSQHRRRRDPAPESPPWRSSPTAARRRAPAAGPRRRRRAPGRRGRPAGSTRPGTTASRCGCRTPGRACRSPCRAPMWRRVP